MPTLLCQQLNLDIGETDDRSASDISHGTKWGNRSAVDVDSLGPDDERQRGWCAPRIPISSCWATEFHLWSEGGIQRVVGITTVMKKTVR